MLGAHYEASRCEIPIVGGDTKLGFSKTFFGVALGFASNKKSLFLKTAAKTGHNIWVSGDLGSTACSVEILSSKTEPWQRRE